MASKNSPIAIIPARSGSKRIPGKNIRLFNGRPVISYAIACCLESKLFSRVIVSTDSMEIAEIAKQCGAEVPFLRSVESSSDNATTAEVMVEVLGHLGRDSNSDDIFCCMYPCTPLMKSQMLVESFGLMSRAEIDSVIPVLEYSYPIQRALEIDQSGKLRRVSPENAFKRTQDLPKSYHDSGQFYWFRARSLFASKSLFGKTALPFLLPALNAQDIDSEEDWRMAELKFKFLYSELDL